MADFEADLVSDLESPPHNGWKAWVTLPLLGYVGTLIVGGTISWMALNQDVAAQSDAIQVEKERNDKQETAIDDIKENLGDLKTGQAVLKRDVDSIGSTLERIEDKLDRQ